MPFSLLLAACSAAWTWTVGAPAHDVPQPVPMETFRGTLEYGITFQPFAEINLRTDSRVLKLSFTCDRDFIEANKAAAAGSVVSVRGRWACRGPHRWFQVEELTVIQEQPLGAR